MFTEDQGLPRDVFLPALLFCSHAHPYAPVHHPLRRPSPWEMQIHGNITSFFSSSMTAAMIGEGAPSPKSLPLHWEDGSTWPHRRESMKATLWQQQLLFPKTFIFQAPWKHAQRDYKTGRQKRHTVLQAPTTELSSGLCNFYIINLCVCPFALDCQERLLTEHGRNPLAHALNQSKINSTELPKPVPPYEEKLQIPDFFPALY